MTFLKATLALSLCATAVSALAQTVPADVPLPRSRPTIVLPVEPRSFAEAVAGLDLPAEITSAPSECFERLKQVATIEPVPRRVGPGACGGFDLVRVRAFVMPDKSVVAMTPPPELRCPMAETLAAWLREDAVPALKASPLRAVENYDSYECRGRNRIKGAKTSEHGKGNAIDIRALKLANGTAIDPTDAAAPRDVRDALRTGACARFMTVLGPGSDPFHENHLHLDVQERRGNYKMCQWDIRDRPPSGVVTGVVPLPVPRPHLEEENQDERRG